MNMLPHALEIFLGMVLGDPGGFAYGEPTDWKQIDTEARDACQQVGLDFDEILAARPEYEQRRWRDLVAGKSLNEAGGGLN